MSKNLLLIVPFSVFFFLNHNNLFGQNNPISFINDNVVRELQLQDSTIEPFSFAIRPISAYSLKNKYNAINQLPSNTILNQEFLKGSLSLIPLELSTAFNSSRPFGWNNGSMIKAKGLQYRISSGLNYNSKFFEASFNPEYVMAANSKYDTSIYFGRTTNVPYKRYFMGQSFANLKFNKFLLGFSNQNIWWGPGYQNSLLFSNNAPGFGHLHFSTQRPVSTPLGHFEWQVIAGGLDQDTTLNSETAQLKLAKYTRKWRYVNGVVLSFQPKFIPGFYLGFTRALQLYGNDNDTTSLQFFEKYLPAVNAFFKKKINTQADAPGEVDGKDQVASIFMRFLMPKSHFEFYLEYGYNDFKANIRDLIQDAQHSSAYIVGFKKIIPTTTKSFYSLNFEIVQMAQSSNYTVRNAGNWYVSGTIFQGFTHMNQILGAGSGVGNNIQSINFEKVIDLKRYGLKVLRIQNDPRGQFTDVNNLWLSNIAWNDFVFGSSYQIKKNNFLINGEVLFVNSRNYFWLTKNKFNLNTSINIIYQW